MVTEVERLQLAVKTLATIAFVLDSLIREWWGEADFETQQIRTKIEESKFAHHPIFRTAIDQLEEAVEIMGERGGLEWEILDGSLDVNVSPEGHKLKRRASQTLWSAAEPIERWLLEELASLET